ncbi:MAG: hypothetical protein AAGM84_01755 [Pseudomonadota bacterium]
MSRTYPPVPPPSWFDKLVDWLGTTKLFHAIARYILTPYWAMRTPTKPLPGGAANAIQGDDNVQSMMNLIMPLKDKSPIGEAQMVLALSANLDEIYAGLDNVGTVHFARFIIVDGNLCMVSVYDGDFSNYIRDFIATIGSVFDAIVTQIEDGDKVVPCGENAEAFIEWVHERDLWQAPDAATDLLVDWHDTNTPNQPLQGLRELPRELILQLKANPNISLGHGYRRYPGFSAAQIRKGMGVGW